MSDELDEKYLDVLESLSRIQHFTDEAAAGIHKSVKDRLSINQWLDENENEWSILDNMCRSRPWATNKDKPFPYPFKDATREMRQAGEPLWLGDTEESVAEEEKPSVRQRAPDEVLTNIAPAKEYPPMHRVLLFTPEFGASSSYSSQAWSKLAPKDKVDVWTVCWQGWSDFDTMLGEVYRRVETFADGVSTVWFGHAAGAIVMYECLKRMHGRQAPCLPVAAFASGCPAPHLFEREYNLLQQHPWLNRLRVSHDFESLADDELQVLSREFSVCLQHELEADLTVQAHYGIALPAYAASKLAALPKPSPAQRSAMVSDMSLLRSYQFRHDADTPVLIPLVAIQSDADEIVPEESVEAWAQYTTAEFQAVQLGDEEDGEVLTARGHGFARDPPQALLRKVQELATKYQIVKDVDDPAMLPDIGPTDGELPDYVQALCVGAGITGVCAMRSFYKEGMDGLIVEKSDAVGGIWKYYANVYSRVNTSEVGYRIMDQTGPTARPNQDHSPRHDILRDIYTVCSEYAHGKVRCGWEVTRTEKQNDESWLVTCKRVQDGAVRQVRAGFVLFGVNRRIGARRDVTFPSEASFRGDICYGYANEVRHLKFWGKRVIVVGAGAFAFENLRTALEHGAKHVTILGRRSGTTCPKWIDMLAFIRPLDENYMTHKAGNMVSQAAWQKCYMDAGLDTPECWKEGLLKPHNHTISVSDLAYIGGFHGMVDLKVGQIKRFDTDGHRVELMDGSFMDVDVVIKCTGFHLNDQVAKITGKTHMYPNYFVDVNMAYIAEPLLDGGQFGSAKGMEDDSDLKTDGVEQFLAMNTHKMDKLPSHISRMFYPRGNPFGSGYGGGLLAQSMFIAWMAKNRDKQREVLAAGKPRMGIVQYWSSHIGIGMLEEMKDVLAKACGGS